MKTVHGGQIRMLALDQIEVGPRLRPVRTHHVENLVVMAEDTGITTPIHVRRTKGKYLLIDGAHRLEAARRIGLPEIAALVYECRADEARAMEASNNLGAARMTPLQTAVFLASWKRSYYALHPDRKPGIFKGNQHTGNLVGCIVPLTRTIADALGVNEATVKRALMAGERLSHEEVRRLEAAPRRVTMKDLRDLVRINDPTDRAAVVEMLGSGKIKNVASARRALDAERGLAPPPKNRKDEDYAVLIKAWKRAPLSARKRLLSECESDFRKIQEVGGSICER
ncbi:ParB/RepB/Spo0J family partition protein [Cereibacter sphaeroides]|uniref:ParB/RepB/Spo0J family partition protein n=1 Tax=Cereibacter sphaeroides TaxID=1063 RepID=UPI003FCE0DE4